MKLTNDPQTLTPPLKWAGGKRWLVSGDQLDIPSFEGTYFEPFLGGGAAFFHLSPKTAVLSDTNTCLLYTSPSPRDRG